MEDTLVAQRCSSLIQFKEKRVKMNDTFSSDAWKKLQKKKEDSCFSNLVQRQKQRNDQEVAKKVRKSYE